MGILKPVDPTSTYKETQIKTANQGRLIVMLYEGAIKNINKALEFLGDEHRRYDETGTSISKAQDIIAELMVSLDFEKGGDIAKNLFSLYIFMNQQLMQANLKKDEKTLIDVKEMLSELRDVWIEITKRGDVEMGSEGSGGINIAG
jgi:flagellar protein FliS